MKSNDIGELASALAKAQAKIKGALKDSNNPFFKTKYADLQSVWDVVREPLTSNGLSIVQVTASNNGQLELVTVLMHASGQWIEGRFPIVALKNEPQAIGSATSYARRYSLAAMVGVYQTDDDAEQAQARNQPAASTKSALGTALAASSPAQPALVAKPEVVAATGSLGAPFDLILQKGPHAGKQIQELSLEQAQEYFSQIEEELKTINRSPATLRGPGRDVFYALQQYVTEKKG